MPYTDTYNVAPSSTGLTAPLSLGSDFIDAARALPHAIKHKDTAYITELSVRLLVIPIGIISCIERIVALGIELFQKLSNFALILQASIMGLVFVSVELILETYRFLRILSFAKKYKLLTVAANPSESSVNNIFEKIKTERLPKEGDNQTIYNAKYSAFVRRMRPWVIENLISAANNPATSYTEKLTLVQTMATQIKKSALTYLVGALAMALAVTSIALPLILFNPIPPMIIGSISLILELGRYFSIKAFLDQKGWSWSFTACLPEFLQKKLSPHHTGNHVQSPSPSHLPPALPSS